MEQLREQMFNGVLDRGYVVQFVPADPTSVLHKGVPYAYTAGRSMAERPELLVTGLDRGNAESLLAAFVEVDLHDVRQEHPAYRFIAADTAPLLGAIAMFGAGHVRAIQILWQDENGRYPDEDPRLRARQPIHPLGKNPLTKHDPYEENE